MLTDLNLYLYDWSNTGSSKKIAKECMNIVINTLIHIFNLGNQFFYSESTLIYKFLQLSPICGLSNIMYARNMFWQT